MLIKTIASSSKGCCYLIESGGEQLLIECGIPLKKIREALNFDLSRVAGCLISHEHKDHCRALADLILYTRVPSFGGIFIEPFYKCTPVNSGQDFKCGSRFTVKPVSLNHDVECYGYIIKSDENVLFYATDTSDVSFKIEGLTHLMIEANHSLDTLFESKSDPSVIARAADFHLDIDSAIEFAGRHKKTLKEVHLLHLSDAHSDEALFLKMAQEELGIPVYIAKKGV